MDFNGEQQKNKKKKLVETKKKFLEIFLDLPKLIL